MSPSGGHNAAIEACRSVRRRGSRPGGRVEAGEEQVLARRIEGGWKRQVIGGEEKGVSEGEG